MEITGAKSELEKGTKQSKKKADVTGNMPVKHSNEQKEFTIKILLLL